MTKKSIQKYSPTEEFLNISTHGLGFVLSIFAFPFLVQKALTYSFLGALSFVVYGISLLVLYAASTLYHAAKKESLRQKLNIFDHAAIYVLIAGSYTPFCLVVLPPTIGYTIGALTWIFALIGIVLKLFFTGRFRLLSTLMYVFMGWQIVFAIKPLMNSLSEEGLHYLLLGGIFYTVGAILYSIKKIPLNHAIFHVFVLLGSGSHFYVIYFLL